MSLKSNDSCVEREERGMHTRKHGGECHVKAKTELRVELAQDQEY